MPKINVGNLNDVESGFVTLPDGAKLLTEVAESSKIAKSLSGAPKITFIFKILEEGEFEGKVVSSDFSLQPQALWRLKNFLEVIGVEWDEEGFELEDTFGKAVIIENTAEEYEGQARNRINNFYAAA